MNDSHPELDCDADTRMSYTETQTGKQEGQATALAASAPTVPPRLLHWQYRKALEAQLDRILAQFGRPEAAIDTGRVRQMLVELSADIRSGTSVIQGSDYHWILGRLTRTYAQGLRRRAREPFTTTAAAYAQVVGTISREYPSHDYSEAVGQLFCYMSRLFRTQQNSWKAVYEHIISIPDSVEAKQLLNRAFFVEIQDWAEAGVENLFSIRQDLLEKIGELEARIEELDRRVAQIADEPKQGGQTGAANGSNIIDLFQARLKRRISSLQRKRELLRDQKEDEKAILALIESDIREFEEKLRNTRRAYFLRSV